MLKRLRGTPIIRHNAEFAMVYSPHPPYEVLQTRDIDFATMQRLRRFARYWDLIANSGNFIETTPLVWSVGEGEDDAKPQAGASPFRSFLRLCDWLHETTGRKHAIALKDLANLLHDYLTTVRRLPAHAVAQVIWRDYQRGGRSDVPAFLRPYVSSADARRVRPRAAPAASTSPAPALPRQARHLRG